MKCSKKTIAVLVLLVLVCSSAFAWPSVVKKTEVVEPEVAVKEFLEEAKDVQPEVKVEEPKAEKKISMNFFSKPESNLQPMVSKAQETLLSKSSNSKKVEELEKAMTDIESGVKAMERAYDNLWYKAHMTVVPSFGMTFNKTAEDTFANSYNVGLSFITTYKKASVVVGATKGVDFKDLKGSFTTLNGLTVNVGFGYRIF